MRLLLCSLYDVLVVTIALWVVAERGYLLLRGEHKKRVRDIAKMS